MRARLSRLASAVSGFLARSLRTRASGNGVAGRALVALALVGALLTGSWFVLAGQQEDTASSNAQSLPAVDAGRVPAILRAAAPVNATAPLQDGLELSNWAKRMAKRMDIPPRALAGYAAAEVRIRKDLPDCRLSWVTLAGIGRTASDHGRADGHSIRPTGTMSTPLNTLPLRGADGKAVDTTATAGPMQLPLGLWERWQRSEDGKPNPQNIDDAALTTATALCSEGRDTATGEGWWSAIKSVRDSDLYLQRVLAHANVYGTMAQAKRPIDPKVLRSVRFAVSKIGLPYVWGGNGLEGGHAGFDCSGLTTYSYADAGVELPRTAHTQYFATKRVPANEEPRLGDLVFYGNPRTKVHHVGMYIGNGQMINAPTFGQAVQIHSYRTPGDDYTGAGRPVA